MSVDMRTQFKQSVLHDPSLWVLLFSNLIAILFAVREGWDVLTLMWVYWFQNVTIGFFNFIRILQLGEFSTEGFNINNKPALATQGTKVFTAFFFLFHYGFFHFVYLMFLLSGAFVGPPRGEPGVLEWKFVLLTAVLFFGNHLFSYMYHRPKDTKKQNIGTLMVYPYARIIPMHLTIILGSVIGAALPLFLVLKTGADAVMHMIEHTAIRKGEEQQSE